MLPDGSINGGEMTSFNHYAFGAIGDWLHRHAAGLAPAAPGYRRITIKPRPGPALTRAAARLRTPYGPAASEWVVRDGELTLTVTVPPNATAEVFLPFGTERSPIDIGSGSHVWRVALPQDVSDRLAAVGSASRG
jgi:alpha-L-rhamnosidase